MRQLTWQTPLIKSIIKTTKENTFNSSGRDYEYYAGNEKYEIKSVLDDKFPINFNKVSKLYELSTAFEYDHIDAELEDILGVQICGQHFLHLY